MASEGELVGSYRLCALLGRGGAGEVWLAFDNRRQREVALKLLAGELAGRREFQVRFEREARVTARLRSVHVIPVHDFGQIDGRPFLDMRLARGGDLAAAIAAAPAGMPPWRAVAILAQIADALDAAHAEGLVHRDVKPSNVLLVAQHGGDFCYLTDFGIVKVLYETGGVADMTQHGVLLGTPLYMAPELVSQAPVPSVASDVYALGCVFYEMLCGRPPFTGATGPWPVFHEHLHADIPPPSGHHPGLAAFDPVIAAALAKDPARRHRTAGTLARAAEAALHAPPPRRAPWWRTRAAVLGAACVLVLAVAAAITVPLTVGSPGYRGVRSAPTGAAPTRAVPTTLHARPVALAVNTPSGMALTPDHRRAYIADQGPSGASTGSVAVVDLGRAAVVATIPVGPDPRGIAVSPDGRRAYVADTGFDDTTGNTVSVIDTTTNTVLRTIPTGTDPLGVALTPDGRLLYVTNAGTNDVPGNTVTVVDTASSSVAATVPVGSMPLDAASSPDGRTVYVANGGTPKDPGNTLSVIDTASNTVRRTVTVGDDPNSVVVSPDGGRVYAADFGTDAAPKGSVSVLDPTREDRPVTSIYSPLDAPLDVTVTPDGRHLLVATNDPDARPPHYCAALVDTATNRVTSTVALAGSPYDIVATDNSHGYVTTKDHGVYALEIG